MRGLSGKQPLPWRIWSLRRTLRALSVDIVHFNDAHAITLGGLAAWHVPGVVTIAARRASFAIRAPGRYRRLCDRVFCVSSCAAERCVQAGIPSAQLRVIHDGVDPNRVATGDRQRGRAALGAVDDLLLLSVGSLVECKGHRFLVDAMPEVLEHFPTARLVLAGAGDQETALRGQIARLQLQSRIQLLGFRSDIPDLLHACDLFVFPSIEEGLGSTLIDVMLAHRPIVATTAGGIPDIVGASLPGPADFAWIVQPGNARALCHAIVSALHDPQACAGMTARASQRAWDLFTVDRMVDTTVSAYREAIAAKHAPTAST